LLAPAGKNVHHNRVALNFLYICMAVIKQGLDLRPSLKHKVFTVEFFLRTIYLLISLSVVFGSGLVSPSPTCTSRRSCKFATVSTDFFSFFTNFFHNTLPHISRLMKLGISAIIHHFSPFNCSFFTIHAGFLTFLKFSDFL